MSARFLIRKSPLCTSPIVSLLLAYMVGLIAGSACLVPLDLLAATAVFAIVFGLYSLARKHRGLAIGAFYIAIFVAGNLATGELLSHNYPPPSYFSMGH